MASTDSHKELEYETSNKHKTSADGENTIRMK